MEGRERMQGFRRSLPWSPEGGGAVDAIGVSRCGENSGLPRPVIAEVEPTAAEPPG